MGSSSENTCLVSTEETLAMILWARSLMSVPVGLSVLRIALPCRTVPTPLAIPKFSRIGLRDDNGSSKTVSFSFCFDTDTLRTVSESFGMVTFFFVRTRPELRVIELRTTLGWSCTSRVQSEKLIMMVPKKVKA